MRPLALAAFLLDGLAAVGYVGVIALGDGRLTPLDALVLTALLVGFFSALGAVLQPDEEAAREEETATLLIAGAAMFDNLTEDAKDDVRQHFPHPERRRSDGRREEAVVLDGPERPTSPDRRESPATAPKMSEVPSAIDRELAHSSS